MKDKYYGQGRTNKSIEAGNWGCFYVFVAGIIIGALVGLFKLLKYLI